MACCLRSGIFCSHEGAGPSPTRLEGRIRTYELAARMQLSAPEIFDLTGETETTRQLYGLDEKGTEDFGRRCLIARRLIERGVRFVQVWSGAGGPGDRYPAGAGQGEDARNEQGSHRQRVRLLG